MVQIISVLITTVEYQYVQKAHIFALEQEQRERKEEELRRKRDEVFHFEKDLVFTVNRSCHYRLP